MFQAGDSLRKAKRTYNKAKEKCRRAWINVRDAAQIVWKGTKLIVVSVVAPFTRLDGITIFTGALAFVAYLQWLTLEKTDQTLRAAQRPWMKYLNISVASPLTYNANGTAVTLSYLLKNTGNSPAQYVFPHTFGSINPGDFFDVAKQRLRCESERNRPSSAPYELGLTYFPGDDSMEQKVGVLIGKNEIAQTLSRQPETFQFIFPVIISCINYRFPFGAGEGHQTGIIMKLDRIDPNPPQPGTSVGIDTKLGPIPAGDLRLTISPVGSYAD